MVGGVLHFEIEFSSFPPFITHIHKFPSNERVNSCKQLLSSIMNVADNYSYSFNFTFVNKMYMLLSFKSSKIKFLHSYYISKMYHAVKKILPLNDISSNKLLINSTKPM